MSQDVKVCVLFGFGINCDRETAAVFKMVGGSPERLHVNRLVHGERSLSEFDILAVPGGFSFEITLEVDASLKPSSICIT